jgi:hypothetical protein
MPDMKLSMTPYFPTTRQAFWVASEGPFIIANILNEADQSWQIAFSDPNTLDYFRQLASRKGLKDKVRPSQIPDWMVAPLTAAFFEKTYPVDKPEQRKVAVMDWIAQQYLEYPTPILTEDLHEIGKNIAYFTRLKNSGLLKDKTIEGLSSFEELQQSLEPFAHQRAQKNLKRQERRLDETGKNEIITGTTMLYKSDLGRVVLVHNVAASQHWGNNTKWCISAKHGSTNLFLKHSARSPVVMLLPRYGGKIAMTGGKFWDSTDHMTNDPGDEGAVVLINCIASLDARSSKAIEKMTEKAYSFKVPQRKRYLKGAIGALTDFTEIIAAVGQDGRNIHFVQPHFRNIGEVVLAAVLTYPDAIKLAHPENRNNEGFMINAFSNNPLLAKQPEFEHLTNKPAFMMKAIGKDRYLFSIIGEKLKTDMNFIRRTLSVFPETAINMREFENPAQFDDDAILKCQIDMLEKLLKSPKKAKARTYLRFLKPLWRQPDRIFGNPTEQIAYLKEQFPFLNTPKVVPPEQSI